MHSFKRRSRVLRRTHQVWPQMSLLWQVNINAFRTRAGSQEQRSPRHRQRRSLHHQKEVSLLTILSISFLFILFPLQFNASADTSVRFIFIYGFFMGLFDASVIPLFLGLFFLDDMRLNLTLAPALAWSSSCFFD
jgi:hypothetical protein